MNRITWTIALLALFAFCTLHGAHAEQADRNKPISVEANVVTDENDVLTLEGNAILIQGTMRLNAEKIIVRRDAEGLKTAQFFSGPNSQVTFRQKREGASDFMEGFADRAEFDDRSDTLKLFSKARLKNGGDEMKGEYIYYNSATEVVQARNTIPDAKRPPNTDGSSGRVYFTIQPRTPEAVQSSPKAK